MQSEKYKIFRRSCRECILLACLFLCKDISWLSYSFLFPSSWWLSWIKIKITKQCQLIFNELEEAPPCTYSMSLGQSAWFQFYFILINKLIATAVLDLPVCNFLKHPTLGTTSLALYVPFDYWHPFLLRLLFFLGWRAMTWPLFMLHYLTRLSLIKWIHVAPLTSPLNAANQLLFSGYSP